MARVKKDKFNNDKVFIERGKRVRIIVEQGMVTKIWNSDAKVSYLRSDDSDEEIVLIEEKEKEIQEDDLLEED